MAASTWSLRVELTADPHEVRRARDLVGGTLRAWRCLVDAEVVTLLVSELVTNAVLHGSGPIELRAEQVGSGIRIEVRDRAPTRFPMPRGISVPVVSGRGLALVDALASRWGWRPMREGKLVWFELDR